MIYEAVITTRNPDGTPHIVPLGYRRVDGRIVLAPFRPSTTLENLDRARLAVLNLTDNVAIIAGCLTGRRDWPTVPAIDIDGIRLKDSLGHMELAVDTVEGDAVRPRFACSIVREEIHATFRGFNRAQAACIEAAILVSRLGMLPAEKVDRELAYLQIAVDKTAGETEQQAWSWLMEAVRGHRAAEKR